MQTLSNILSLLLQTDSLNKLSSKFKEVTLDLQVFYSSALTLQLVTSINLST